MHQVQTALIGILRIKKIKLQLFGLGITPRIQKKYPTNNYTNEVSKAANGLKKLGIKKGDRVTIYLTMIPELAITMLSMCKNWCCSFNYFWWFLCRFDFWQSK